mmetsp:Transcript_744/g.1800  ORF Transcript_744/g.1800 Transcript_744/m.1800 type:complete len:723 (+) Transcript_744:355-2523(+)
MVYSKRKHRVLIYTTCYNVLDGVTLTLRKIEQEILARGHSVCILSTKSGNIKNTHMHMEENDEFHRYRHLPDRHPNRTVIFLDNSMPIPFLQDPNNSDNSYHLGFSLSKGVKVKLTAFDPTIVHVTVPDVTCMHLIQFAREKQLPLMGTYHSNIADYFTHYPGIGWLKHVFAAYERHQYNFLQALFVPTPFIQRHLSVEEHYRFHSITNLKVWGRGADLERFHPSHRSEDYRARYGFAPNDVVVTWVGRLVPEKRPDIFAYVVRRLASEGISFKALIVGAGPSENEMKSLPNTVFAGWATGDELSVAYASSDLFLFPSAVETFGNVTLEAAASGLPLVVDSGCSGHLVQDGVSGFACKDGDLEAYYNATLSLVMDKARREAMSKEGRKLCLKFEKRAVCRKMIENYSNITKEFYGRYRGNHANRDRKYEKKSESFVGGCYVRPTSLILVEFLFIFIFRVTYTIVESLFKLRRFVGFIGTRKHSTASGEPIMAIANNPLSSTESSSTDDLSEPISSSADSLSGTIIPSHDGRNSNGDEVVNYFEMEDSIDDHDTSSIDDSTISCDGTASSSSCCSVSSSVEWNRRYAERMWQSELPISHNLAILFVKGVRAQGIIESRIRKWYSRKASSSDFNGVFSGSDRKNYNRRKRKCSEELTPNDFDSTELLQMDLKEPLLPKSCSSSTGSSRSSDTWLAEEHDMTFMPTTSDQGLNSRKMKSSSNLLV